MSVDLREKFLLWLKPHTDALVKWARNNKDISFEDYRELLHLVNELYKDPPKK